MVKKYVSLLLATVITTSLITTKTSAEPINNNYLNRFKAKEALKFSDKDKTLGELMKEGKFKDLVIHNAAKSKISTFGINENNLREGDLNNIVINVRFKGEDEFLSSDFNGNTVRNTFDNMYNNSNLSLKEYYKEISNSKLNVQTTFIGKDNIGTESIELNNERNYYRPYSRINTEGYFDYVFVDKETGEFFANAYIDDEKEDIDPSDGIVTKQYENYNDQVVLQALPIDRVYRELSLMNEISEKVSDTELLNINIDKNNDTMIDAVTVIVGVTNGQPVAEQLGWNELLWPHQADTLSYLTEEEVQMYKFMTNIDLSTVLNSDFELGNKQIDKYNLYTSDFLLLNGLKVETDKGDIGYVGVVAHELAHTLGLPDLYNYLNQADTCVGTWDLMAFTGIVPQYTNGYMRKEAGWLSDTEIPTVEKDGEYELKPVTSTAAGEITGYIIQLPEYPEQKFFLEYRKTEGNFEGGFATVDGVPFPIRAIQPENSGLVIYRIDNSVQYLEGTEDMIMPGNFLGYPYNTYVFRSNADIGDETKAAITGVDRTSFGSLDVNEIANAITFQAGIGENNEPKLVNSRVVIENVSLDEDNNKIKFLVDAKDPSVINVDIVDNKIVIEVDEKISSESNLDLVKIFKAGAEQQIKSTIINDNKIEISLVNGEFDGAYTLNIASKAIVDVVGKTLLQDFTKDLTVNKTISVEKVELNKVAVSLKVGATEMLVATVSPEKATNKNVKWTSDNEAVAKVDENGKVSAVAKGTATITVTTLDGNKTAICKVTVEEKSLPVNPEDKGDTTKPEDIKKPTNTATPEPGKGSNNALPQAGGTSSLPISLLGVAIITVGISMTKRKTTDIT